MELIGIIKKINETQTFQSGFTKRELIILTTEQYPQPISIDFFKEKGELLDSLNEGDQVKVGININGREWQAPDGQVRYFNSIVGWRIEKTNESNNQQDTFKQPLQDTKDDLFGDDSEDLPF
ncbi:DUF3127 domain-containing protein [Elizabethkingia bruuniana]|uniref:DUF3127 domain-containing protein n=1 Tax=Elizabethkingia bruuniana TaxID=1756149 RepID=UPI000BEAFD5A|nr:DUF3127 domain-containing protein [Elizabethkingia bruuniana]ATL41829.1 hypothetical protein CQS02_00185 [Elizabethkingia miricola]MCL1636223.1 DUF3127 domain-containing protein [Elizabethkingia bruuniana]